MHLLMIADAYPPMRTSCAVQMYDLGQAFIEAGHQVTIIVPASALAEKVRIQTQDGVRLVEVRALQTKGINYLQRTFAELINPLLIWFYLKGNKTFNEILYTGIIWYSPTIFWGPLVKRLKNHFKIPSYLILRDIFPDWALDLGILKKGPIYLFFKSVEQFQYSQADTIGVQSPNNLKYFVKKYPKLKNRACVLWNWSRKARSDKFCTIDLSASSLTGRTLCIYAGNMGKAQGMDLLLDLAGDLKNFRDIGFVLVGRGSEVLHLQKRIKDEELSNVLLLGEISHGEIPGLYSQCDIGILMLDLKHKTHNIPGKWIGYLQAGLPVFALINAGNDMFDLIEKNQLGFASSTCDLQVLSAALKTLKQQIINDTKIKNRAISLYEELFSCQQAAHLIARDLYLSSAKQ